MQYWVLECMSLFRLSRPTIIIYYNNENIVNVYSMLILKSFLESNLGIAALLFADALR